MAQHNERPVFDPDLHKKTMKLRGTVTPYLPAAKKVQFLYTKYPKAQIQIVKSNVTPENAEIIVRVTLPNGGFAESIGYVTKAEFGEYVEKAETVATARACTRLGFDLGGKQDEFDPNYIPDYDDSSIAETVKAEQTPVSEDTPEETPASLSTVTINEVRENLGLQKIPEVEPNDTETYVRDWSDFPIDHTLFTDKNKTDEELEEIARTAMHDAGYSVQGFLRYLYHAQEDQLKGTKKKPKAFAVLTDVPYALVDSAIEWLVDQESEVA